MKSNDFRVAFFIAYKAITEGNKSVSILLVAVLSLVFFNLIFIKAFLSGFSTGILNTMIDNTTSHIVISPQEKPLKKSFIVNQGVVRKQIETIPGVIATTRHYLLGGSIAFDKDKTGQLNYIAAPIIAFNQAEDKKVMRIKQAIVSGDFPDTLADDEIILGANLAGGYPDAIQSTDLGGARAGDKVQVIYSNGATKTYTVRGVFKITIGFVSNNAFISDKEAERIFSLYDQASEILVRTDLTTHGIDDYVTKIRELVPSLKVEGYSKKLAAVGVLVDAFNGIAFIIGIISIIVAAATIFIMIYINALSRKKQLGILKAVGIKEGIIETSYMFQSLFFVVLATIVGSILFYGVASPYLVTHPIEMPYGNAILVITTQDVFASAGMLALSALLAGRFSSGLIARKKIVETVWG